MLGFSTQHPTVSYGTERPHLPPLGPAGVTKSSPGMADCHETPFPDRPFRQRNRPTSITYVCHTRPTPFAQWQRSRAPCKPCKEVWSGVLDPSAVCETHDLHRRAGSKPLGASARTDVPESQRLFCRLRESLWCVWRAALPGWRRSFPASQGYVAGVFTRETARSLRRRTLLGTFRHHR